jgi:hypothetical protein
MVCSVSNQKTKYQFEAIELLVRQFDGNTRLPGDNTTLNEKLVAVL